MIIDAHAHFYDPTRPQGAPWPNPNDEFLYRTVLPKHFKEVAVPAGITGTIVVEASEWVEDNAWVLDIAEGEPFIVGVVGNLEPGSEGFGQNLDRFAANPLFLGIRLRGSIVDQIADATVAADLMKLAEKGLEADLLTRPEHLPATADLALRLPELRIVVNHVAGVPIDGEAPEPAWVDGIRAVAEHGNVFCKVSGLGSMTRQMPAPTDPAFYVPTLDVLWEAFGEDRLIYGSDWPVSARAMEYATVKRVVADYFTAKGEDAAEKYFWRNSEVAYRWVERQPGRSDRSVRSDRSD